MRDGQGQGLYPEIASYVVGCLRESGDVPVRRREPLERLAVYIEAGLSGGEGAKLVFICTHNSRRSHMAQIWAQAAAFYFGIPKVKTFSGGTEATAFNPRAVAVLRRAGFRIDKKSEGENPMYDVRYSGCAAAMKAFSKLYSSPPNPRDGFCAVMTCAEAERSCPVVPGASLRVAVPYEDPRESDGTAREEETYDERCRQMCREMLYVLSRVRR